MHDHSCWSAFAYTDVGTSRSAGMRVSDEGAVNFDAGSRARIKIQLRLKGAPTKYL